MRSAKKFKLVVFVLLFTLAAAGTAMAAGKVFSDVKSGVWYEKPVAEMKAKGIVQGTGADTFSPDTEVTVQESIVFLGRLLDWEDGATTLPSTLINRSRVDTWAKGYVTAAVGNRVISGADLYLDPKAAAQRYEIAIFAVRALGLDDRARGRSGVSLEYADAADVPDRAVGYIDVAAEEGILTGNPDGSFKPKDSITRAQMAAVLERMEAKLDEERGNVVKGEFFGVITANGNIRIRQTDSQIKEYEVADSFLVYDGSSSILLSQVQALDAMSLVLDETGETALFGEVIDESEIQPQEFNLDGEITGVDTDTPSLTIDKEDGTDVTYTIADDAAIRLDYKEAELDELVAGQAVEIKVEGDLITQIMAESFEETVEGIVVKVEFGSDTRIIVSFDDEDEEESYLVDEDVDIDGDASGLRDIFAGQEVELELFNNRVINIDVTSVEDEAEGTITKLILAADPEVVVNVDGVERTFTFAPDASLEKDNDDIEIEDVRIGDYVELEITGRVVTYMDVTAKVVADYVMGEIENINDDAEVIIFKDNNTPIYLNDDTVIIKFGEEARLRHLNTGDEVFAVGIFKSGILEADTIVVIAATK
ncbi:S-layer homology domain-containing protein [Metallumcola ferriviriculae]|uniref:S-layer homology domain-containing protein n=1 Tax=Metallumcola ferriviriculae TaxID=3039180 RepID=A0AAU0UJU8_9FIRM|nr:S-layer homology domain-containing protein [Desulfitibacteraceae bacterium MK1]